MTDQGAATFDTGLLFSSENDDVFQRMLRDRPEGRAPVGREKKLLKKPVTRVSPDNIFTWHLSQQSMIEAETDPELVRQRVWQRRVGVKESGRLTEDQIAAHEERLGIRLPMPWRDVYRHFNGGIAHDLYWGDLNAPRIDDVSPCTLSRQFLALEDVAPLRDILPMEWEANGFATLDPDRIDPRLIAIACERGVAILLDYREGDVPRVCNAFISQYEDDPLAVWETDKYTKWWPNTDVFFRGLYLQQRV